jgi:cardiolipin synthase
MSEFSLRHQIPNLLTLARIAAVPVLILFLYDGRYGAALAVFMLAGITDGLDGWIAKRFKCVTRLGSILDPLADKILIVSTYVMLVLAGDLPFWLILLIGFRDLGIIAGVLVLNTLNGHVQMQPSLLSKVNTFLQISLVILVMVERIGFIALEPVAEILLWFVAVTTVASAIHYVYFWFIHPLESRVDQKVESKD